MSEQEPYELEDCEVLAVLEKSMKVHSAEHGEIWIPLSQVHDDNDTSDEGDRGTILVTQWLAEQRGWV